MQGTECSVTSVKLTINDEIYGCDNIEVIVDENVIVSVVMNCQLPHEGDENWYYVMTWEKIMLNSDNVM